MMNLESPVQYLKGVGPRKAELLKKLGVETLKDLLYLSPRRWLDRSVIKPIGSVRNGETVTVVGEVLDAWVETTKGGKKIGTVVIWDGTGALTGRWFNQDWVEKVFKKHMKVVFSGEISFFRGFQILNPEYEILESEDYELVHTGRIVPLYPLTAGLNQKFMRKLVKNVIENYLHMLHDPVPEEIRNELSLYPLPEAIRKLHFPEKMQEIEEARKRLAWDEIFYVQVFLAERKLSLEKKPGIGFNPESKLLEKFLSSLPFELTSAQKRVLSEIKEDMRKETPMNRLLQGDVGSGKTVIALSAMLIAVDNGYQAALMAPTEILASQHFYVFKNFLRGLGVPVLSLLGGMKKTERKLVLTRLENGEPAVVVGTHALLEEDVKLPKLGLVVIDEQHRFGVLQRSRLREKGDNVDVLVMTATPIPRTLTLTIYGDLDVSVLDELPPGRKPVKTRWVREDKREKVYEWLRERIEKGEQAYVVLPLIEESEKLNLRAVVEMYEELKKRFPSFRIGMLHGRMGKDEKEGIMDAFRKGEIQILVSTTVIEVGVDVPDATIMIIEHAERFGLSQLHQLRGRVGRGEKKSYCILITPRKITEDAERRLAAMEQYTDGFKLSEIDLEIRGPGEFFGTRQHGFPDFKFFDIFRDKKLLSDARKIAWRVAQNPKLYPSIFAELRQLKETRFSLIDVG
ncbi:DNA helicase RecG [bacterium]|nr:MAG: DNA helicase RecG [bacterium]